MLAPGLRLGLSASACLAGLVLGLGSPALADEPTPLDSLVDAENRFSALSVAKGMRDAFIEFLADDGVIFRPLPVNGKQVWSARPPVAGTLIWEPEFAEVSAAGDLGYDTGPWEFRSPPDQNRPTVYGHFISVWKKQASGAWRVAVDLGVSHQKPDRGVGSAKGPTLHPAASVDLARAARSSVDLPALDRAFSDATRKKGVGAALAARGSADLRFNTEGAQPFLGIDPARAALDSVTGSMRFVPQGTGLSASRELGYTFGLAERFAPSHPGVPADSSVYLHIWRRGGDSKWKLVLAVWNPLRHP